MPFDNVLRISLTVLLGGCAHSSQEIIPAHVSQFAYRDLNCSQLSAEGRRLQTRVILLGGRLDQAAANDKAIAAAGIIIFWPVLFALGGTHTQEAEYARITGEYDAVQQMTISKDCPSASKGPGQDSSANIKDQVNNVAAVPGLTEKGRAGYLEFLQKPFPRSFVLADGGSFYYAWSRRPRDPSDPADPSARAMKNCLRLKYENCRFYAIDDRVVLY